MTDNHKIAFITCVSNPNTYDECLYYINNLNVPKGYSVEAYGISDATSMASGYQYGMSISNAKYKVYLHQDSFIINSNFITDFLNIFDSNNQIGLIGMIGSLNLQEDNLAVASCNCGSVYHNCTPSKLAFKTDTSRYYEVVDAVDGLIICTSVDINWRDDIFDGWDFYDISQCMEMKRKGYTCVTATQLQPWVYHDNSYSKMTNYYKYRDIFVDEYQDIKSFCHISISDNKLEFDQLKEDSRKQLIELINQGDKHQLISLFSNPESCGYLHLKDFEIFSRIAKIQLEQKQDSFWTNEPFDELSLKLQNVRFSVIRKRFGFENMLSDYYLCYGKEIVQLIESFYQ